MSYSSAALDFVGMSIARPTSGTNRDHSWANGALSSIPRHSYVLPGTTFVVLAVPVAAFVFIMPASKAVH